MLESGSDRIGALDFQRSASAYVARESVNASLEELMQAAGLIEKGLPLSRELYSRLVFNILCGNTDDHARNHAAFWDGKILKLTPAYDICPQGRTGNEASQAMLIAGDSRMSQVSSCLDAAAHFLLSRTEAIAIAESQLTCIIDQWNDVCEEATLSVTDRAFMWGRQFLNPYALENLDGDAAHLKSIAEDARA